MVNGKKKNVFGDTPNKKGKAPNPREPTKAEKDAKKKELKEKKEADEAYEKKLKEEREANRQRWKKDEINLAPYRETTLPSNKFTMKANFFEITFGDAILHKYRVYFKDSKGQEQSYGREDRRALMEKLLEKHKPTAKFWVTDYFSKIISVGQLFGNMEDIANKEHPVDHDSHKNPGAGQPKMKSTIVFEGPVQISELHNIINHQSQAQPTYRHEDDTSALNVISWKNIIQPTWNGLRVGRKFYPKDQQLINLIKMRNGNRGKTIYEARTGFFTSVRPGDGLLLLNVNATTSAFYPPGISVQEWIETRWSGCKLVIPPASGHKELIGLKVFDPLDTNQVIYKILGVSDTTASKQKIGEHADDVQTVWDYCDQNYCESPHGRKSENCRFSQNACCLKLGKVSVGSNVADHWYPADHLQFSEAQILRHVIHPSMDTDMIEIARKNPMETQTCINNYALELLGIPLPGQILQRNFLKDYGLSANDKFLELECRQLNHPKLIYHNGKPVDLKGDTFWGIRDRRFYTAHTYKKLKILLIYTKDHAKLRQDQWNKVVDNASNLGRSLSTHLNKYGLGTGVFDKRIDLREAQEPASQLPYKDRREKWRKLLNDEYDNLGKPSLLVILLPSKDTLTYSDIKWWGDCVVGKPTVCYRWSAIPDYKVNDRTLANLSLKINMKLGGTNHLLENGLPALKPKTMILGADVSHTQKSSDKDCPSVAGVVATRKNNYHLYLASARLQPKNTEFIEDIGGMVKERLVAYYDDSKEVPEHILFYRDGVSESQYGMVHLDELSRVETACKEFGKSCEMGNEWCPKITTLIATKRHHTRFFPGPGLDQQQSPKSGLLVDRKVVAPNRFNFYLQSHDCKIQKSKDDKTPAATARPTHYVVINNESGYTPEELHELTHQLCFVGSKSTTSISVAPPARYADLLCERLRCYMRPILDGEKRKQKEGIGSQQVILAAASLQEENNDYRNDKWSWSWRADSEKSCGKNPWANDLSDKMFYL